MGFLQIFMNKTMMTLMGALVSATIVTAQPAPPAKPHKTPPAPADIFTEADTDGNGQLSMGEFSELIEKGRKQREEAKPPVNKSPPTKNTHRPTPVKEHLKVPVVENKTQ